MARPLHVAPPAGAGGVCLIYDLGTAVTAGVQLDLDAPAGTILDIGYGEHMTDGRLRTRNDNATHRFADRFILAEGRHTVGPTIAEARSRLPLHGRASRCPVPRYAGFGYLHVPGLVLGVLAMQLLGQGQRPGHQGIYRVAVPDGGRE